jgi:hypothetical protein
MFGVRQTLERRPTMTTTIPSTRNEAWGFFGTIQTAGADPMQAWNAASAMIAAETDAAPEGVRDFLDSRHGRHFADDVMSELAKAGPGKLEEAIEAAIARWQGWRHRPADQPRGGHPPRSSLPHRLGHPLPDPRRGRRVAAAPLPTPAALASGQRGSGS